MASPIGHLSAVPQSHLGTPVPEEKRRRCSAGAKKNLSNFREHGVWFEEAQTVRADESSSEFFDPEHAESEARFIRFGYSSVHRLLLVVFVSDRMATPSA